MRRPSLSDLDPAQAHAARGACARLVAEGHRAWLVGGVLRDLALGLHPKDVDLATDAHPDQVEALFERTVAVGKAFGTVIAIVEGVELEITTLRTERGYSDGRRPDAVAYGTTVEEDAARRDFTCNALYLEPAGDRLLDPCGGLADLAARRLRAVGEPLARFREDGLRILRLARFAAAYDLTVDPGTLEGARAAIEALRGVSVERVLAELERIATRPRPGRAVALLVELGALARVLPDLERPGGTPLAERARSCAALGDAPGPALFLAALLAPGPGERETAEALLAHLRPARAVARGVEALWRLEAALRAAPRPAPGDGWRERAARLRLLREEDFPAAARLARARGLAEAAGAVLAELEALRAGLGSAETAPEAWITSADLARAGVPRGPLYGTLLREAEDRRLGGADADRAAALRWLGERTAGEGGREPKGEERSEPG